MGSSGKGGGGGQDYGQVAYGNAYNAAQGGQSWDQVSQGFVGNNAQFTDAGRAGWEAGQPVAPFEFPSFEMPDFSSGFSSQQDSYAESLAAQQAAQEKAMEEARRAAGIADRDSLFGSYMDAAGSATDFVNSEIEREQANARLLGIDYEMNDEMKNTRINDYFASVWGEGEQARLEALMGEWGKPEGFTDFAVTRGDGSAYAGTEGKEESKGVSTGQRPTIATEEDEQQGLGGQTSILGA